MKLEEFYNNVKKGPDCWEWTMHRSWFGYGKLKIEVASKLAHRVSFALEHGREPEGNVLHSCDNPSCVRPDHLREGTQKENVHDAMRKGRWTQGAFLRNKTHCPKGHQYSGENLWVEPNGKHRHCKTCSASNQRQWRDRRRLGR